MNLIVRQALTGTAKYCLQIVCLNLWSLVLGRLPETLTLSMELILYIDLKYLLVLGLLLLCPSGSIQGRRSDECICLRSNVLILVVVNIFKISI